MRGEGDRDRSKRTLAKLRESEERLFSIWDITAAARKSFNSEVHILAHRLTKAGHLVRVATGLYAFPGTDFDLSDLISWEARGPHQLSHKTAMAIHGYGPPLPHPEVIVTVGQMRSHRPLAPDIRLRFILRSTRDRGTPEYWTVPGFGEVPVATPEVTLVEGVSVPELCGGFLAVCGYLGSRRGTWDGALLAKHCAGEGGSALGRRLGLLLEWAGDPAAEALADFRPRARQEPASLDPRRPKPGPLESRWRIRMNVPEESVRAALGLRPPSP